MIALILALAAQGAEPQAKPEPQPIELICTHEQSGDQKPGRAFPDRIEIMLGQIWTLLPASQIAWSCVPKDPKARVPVDPD